MIVHELGYQITPARRGFAFIRPDRTVMPASPQLPVTNGDIAACHDAAITPDTILRGWKGDRLDLDHAIWAAFANARLAEN